MNHPLPLPLSPTPWQSGWCAVVAAVALLTAAAPALAASTCIGDCDQTEQVTVNEILEMVNIALGLDAIAMCAAGDANEDGSITVDEILKAVNLALTRCPLTGSDAGEAAGGVDESTHDGVDAAGRVVGFGAFGLGGGGAAGILAGCPNGGTVDVLSCETSGGSSTRTVRFAACREIDQQTQAATVRTGTVTQVVAAPNVCATGVIPRTAQVTFTFRNFAATTLDATGETTTQIDALTDVFTPSGSGCGGTNGKETIDGVLSVQRDKGAPIASYAYRSFVVETQSVVGSAACIVSKLVNGVLTVDDRLTGRAFSETARDFVITSQQLSGLRALTEAGTLTVDCLGEAHFQIQEPLRIDQQSPCPLVGVLQVTLPDGTVTRTQYTPDGVAFDFDGDGQFDRRIISCVDPKLTRCAETTPTQ